MTSEGPGFYAPDGSWREFADPDGPPTWRQLRWLALHGRLELAGRPGEPLTKASAAREIGELMRELDGDVVGLA